MILIRFLIFSLFILPGVCYGQIKSDKNPDRSHIKKIFNDINAYPHYEIVTIDDAEAFLDQGTDNGAELKGYYRAGALKKIVEWVGLSNRNVQNEYYLDKGRLVFVYAKETMYPFNQKTHDFDYSKPYTSFEGRYYFKDNKLIAAIFSDEEHQKSKQQDAEDFLASGRKYLKLLNTKRAAK